MKKLMKRGIAFVLAAALALVMLPAVAADEIVPTYEYVFNMSTLGATSGSNYKIDDVLKDAAEFKDTERGYGWKPLGNGASTQSSAFYASGYNFSVRDTSAVVGSNGMLFKITVGESGLYNPSIDYFLHQNGSHVNIYLSKKPIGDLSSTNYIRNIINDSSDDVIFADSFNTFGTGITKMWQSVGSDDFDNTTITLEKDTDYYLVFTIDGSKTSNDKAPASATNSKIYYYFQLGSFGLNKVGEIPGVEEDEKISGNVSFVATSNIASGDMMNVNGTNYDKFIDEIPVGTEITVSAPEKEGYEFKHWLRGSKDNGVYISSDREYSFVAMTNIFLTAIYENTKAEDAAVVEFYNGNGQYLESAQAKLGETVSLPKASPEMTGFEFANEWKTEDGVFTEETVVSDKLTRAVAQFTVPSVTFNVSYGDEVYALTYGAEKTFTSNTPVYWVRDNRVVYYGTSYTYAVWDDTVISTVEEGESKPMVVLDSDSKNGARMIEYNAADKKIVEAGIVFGSTDKVTIESCSSKATSQRKISHGQFTAKPYGVEEFARGYLIYKDGEEFKVVYSE